MSKKMSAISVIARTALVSLFPFSAIDKVINWDEALEQANSGPLPGGPALLIAAIAVEAITPICIVSGRKDRSAAAVLAAFCAVTAVLYHPFWKYPDLTAKSQTKGRNELWEFLKNFGLVGGLLMVVFGNSRTLGREASLRSRLALR